MAHTKSARKRIRQDRKRRLRNQAVKTRIRTLTKDLRGSLKGSDPEGAAGPLKAAIRALDRAASKGIIHRRTASRKISRLSRAAHRNATASSSEASAPSSS